MDSVGISTSLTSKTKPANHFVLPLEIRNRRGALVVAHPGHELRIHGWLELARPVVCVFTDGSGHTRQARLASTTQVLDRVHATPGSIYGRFTDIAIYQAILDRDFRLFVDLAEELAQMLVRDEIEYVVGDAVEGYNPTHDLCRAVINTAVELAHNIDGKRVENFDFLPVGNPASCRNERQGPAVLLQLDEAAFNRKLTAARTYSELRDEIKTMTKEMGAAAFQIESLRPVIDPGPTDFLDHHFPFYESYGEKQVSNGVYSRVIRYREHILPLARALMDHARR